MSRKRLASIDLLHRLGFSEYEARAYVALLSRSPLSGYELAKEANVPRPNVYAALDKLAERGAILTVTTPSGARYSPVPPRQLMGRLGSAHQKLLGSAVGALETLENAVPAQSVLNTRGYSTLIEHARSAIAQATTSLLIALWPNESAMLQADLAEAQARGVRVTILCMYACANDCGACDGRVYRYRVAPIQNERWLIIVADGAAIVAGQVGDDDSDGIVSSQKLVTGLAAAYIRNSIALAAIIEDLGPELDFAPNGRAQEILNNLSPQGEKGSFIDYMRRLMADAPPSREPS